MYRPGNIVDLELPPSKVTTIIRRYITSYIVYRFYGEKFTISAGPSINTLVSWKQRPDNIQLSKYKENPRAGFMFKLSKGFDINSILFIEPEIQFANFRAVNFRGIVDNGSSHFSVGFSLKYKY